MLNEHNEYFEHLIFLAQEYDEKRSERLHRKKEIIARYGRESAELEAWYDEPEIEPPFSEGTAKAICAWDDSVSREEDEVEMDTFLWDSEVTDFLNALRSAGIESFVITNQSTGLMGNLHAFAKAGCRMEGLCTITRRDDPPAEIPGIRFIL